MKSKKPISDDMKKRILTAIQYTWNAIAGDWYAVCEQHGGECTLSSAVEGCIDADRTLTFGGDDEAADVLYGLTWDDMKLLGKEALKEYF
jgi:hypothetical protein